MERPIGMRLKGGCAAGFRLRGLLFWGEGSSPLRKGFLGRGIRRAAGCWRVGRDGQPGDANVLCGNGMFGAKIKDEDILSLSEIRDCAFLLKPV